MKIVFVQEHYDDAFCAQFFALLNASGVEWQVSSRPAGTIPFIPCICALDDADVARHVFGLTATAQDLIDAAAEDGTVVVTPVPRVLDAADFSELCYAALGALALPDGSAEDQALAGIARFGAILKAVRADTSDSVVAANDRYESSKAANRFAKDKVAQFFGLIAAHITAPETAAILASWPSV